MSGMRRPHGSRMRATGARCRWRVRRRRRAGLQLACVPAKQAGLVVRTAPRLPCRLRIGAVALERGAILEGRHARKRRPLARLLRRFSGCVKYRRRQDDGAKQSNRVHRNPDPCKPPGRCRPACDPRRKCGRALFRPDARAFAGSQRSGRSLETARQCGHVRRYERGKTLGRCRRERQRRRPRCGKRRCGTDCGADRASRRGCAPGIGLGRATSRLGVRVPGVRVRRVDVMLVVLLPYRRLGRRRAHVAEHARGGHRPLEREQQRNEQHQPGPGLAHSDAKIITRGWSVGHASRFPSRADINASPRSTPAGNPRTPGPSASAPPAAEARHRRRDSSARSRAAPRSNGRSQGRRRRSSAPT
jgi:hypothetical protein